MIKFAFKVDIDTYEGILYGLPRLRKFFAQEKIQATFFITFGPDFSGRAIFRVLKKKGFLEKMIRTGGVKMYGWRTILSGLLLPPHWVGLSQQRELRKLVDDGHEVGIHSWDHTLWHDYLPYMSLMKIESEIQKSWEAFYGIFGFEPRSMAAPGWMITPKALYLEDMAGLLYASDSRGKSPFFPVSGNLEFDTLQIPTTLPTFDEAVGRNGWRADNFHELILSQLQEGLNVHTIHTETEGMMGHKEFQILVNRLRDRGVEFVRLQDMAEKLLQTPKKIPASPLELQPFPGRAGLLACQKVP